MKICPYNVRNSHKDLKELDSNWPLVMKSLEQRLLEKKKSEWFIE